MSVLTADNLKAILSSKAGYAATLIRVPVGLILAAHGTQKLFGWMGGYGLEGTGQWMASVGFEPGYLMALMAGSAEFFGGLALVLGLLTRPAALVLAFMLGMAMTLHVGNGLFMSNNGYEYALTLLVISLALLIQGGGKFSLDQFIATKINSRL